ncbi:MAG TPA: AbrB/MazE/SpoVT family DNA-binding domain-containing protein [Candidatus Binataceae bacterium]|nr:AbrB/MazE/SpoVT family DNA-binding domain-containing protein [Candidatus Binataceae bacterium]
MRVAKWGNSVAVRIPKALAERADLTEGVEVECKAVGKRIVITRRARPRRGKQYSLSVLLRQVTPENRHAEIDWGLPIGREVW